MQGWLQTILIPCTSDHLNIWNILTRSWFNWTYFVDVVSMSGETWWHDDCASFCITTSKPYVAPRKQLYTLEGVFHTSEYRLCIDMHMAHKIGNSDSTHVCLCTGCGFAVILNLFMYRRREYKTQTNLRNAYCIRKALSTCFRRIWFKNDLGTLGFRPSRIARGFKMSLRNSILSFLDSCALNTSNNSPDTNAAQPLLMYSVSVSVPHPP